MSKCNFGTVQCNGETIRLAEEASPSARAFARCFNDAADGESYIAEWQARGTRPNGERVMVYWQFEQVKGQEQEPDTLDWDAPDRIVEL